MSDPLPLLNAKQVAMRLNCHTTTAYVMMRGPLHKGVIRIGLGQKGIRMSAEYLETWLSENMGKRGAA